MSGRLSNDEFLSALTNLLTSTHASTHGSVYLTQKPLPPSSEPTSPDSQQVLVRATNGLSKLHRTDKTLKKTKPKIKLSTVVERSELGGFFGRYAEVCKRGMEGLRKRDKKKAKTKRKKEKGKKAG